MSDSPTVTARSEGRNGGCQPGSRSSEAVDSCAIASDRIERSGVQDTVWLEDANHKHHPVARPVLQYLPTKLAEWIVENMQQELGFPDREDSNKWSVSELNDILRRHVVRDRNGCALHTFGPSFGCIEWESELCKGV